jgi:hypothetical protein
VCRRGWPGFWAADVDQSGARCDASTVRRGALAGLVAGLAVLAGGAGKVAATPPWDLGAHQRDPLLGSWDTGRIRFDRVIATLSRAGYSDPEIRVFLRQFGLGGAVYWRFDVTFYRDRRGAPSLIRMGWDPTLVATPVDGEHGHYRVLAGRRVAITSADRFRRYREIFSYSIKGKTLKFRVVAKTDPTLTKDQLRLQKGLMYVMSAAPFKKISS